MIQGISIENFRGFHKTTIKGFDRINLFGGKNNVGKTSLLEALFVGLRGDFKKLTELRTNSNYDKDKIDEYIFFNKSTDIPINIEIETADWRFLTNLPQINERVLTKANNNIVINDLVKPSPEFWNKNRLSLIMGKNLQYPYQYNLSKELDEVDVKGKKHEILKVIQVIEPKIVDIRTFGFDKDMIYIRDDDKEGYMPMIYYGDAIQKVMRYIITIAAFQNENGSNGSNTDLSRDNRKGGKYLLIDEIENGLHYTVQEEFWEMLFKLAITYNIQIFAATHSREMIAAFDKTALKFDNEAAYFELYRHIKTNEIAANKIRPEVLEYKLENDKPMRGE